MAPKKRKGKARRRAGVHADDVIGLSGASALSRAEYGDRRAEKSRLKRLTKRRRPKRGRKSKLRDVKNIPQEGVVGGLDVRAACYMPAEVVSKVREGSLMPNGTSDEIVHGHPDICPENVKRSPYVLDVTCGDNEAILFMKGLSTGSKGACVLFEQNWLTPNEFQYVSGRESAKDWKRSIKHHGKSLKILVSRGLMCFKQRRCKCYTCEGRDRDDDDEPSLSGYAADQLDRPRSGSSGLWGHGKDEALATKSTRAPSLDTDGARNKGCTDPTKTEVEAKDNIVSAASYGVTNSSLCASQSDSLYGALQRAGNDVSMTTPATDLYTTVKLRLSLVDDGARSGYGIQNATDRRVKSESSDAFAKSDLESISNNEDSRSIPSPGIRNAESSDGEDSLTDAPDERRSPTVYRPSTKSAHSVALSESYRGIPDECGTAAEDGGSRSQMAPGPYPDAAPHDENDRSGKRGLSTKKRKKGSGSGNKFEPEDGIAEKSRRVMEAFPPDMSRYQISPMASNDSSDTCSENSDSRYSEIDDFDTGTTMDVPPTEALAISGSAVPDRTGNGSNTDAPEIAPATGQRDDRANPEELALNGSETGTAQSKDVVGCAEDPEYRLTDRKYESASSHLDQQRLDQSVDERQPVAGQEAASQRTEDFVGQTERFRDSFYVDQSPPTSESGQSVKKRHDSLPTSSADDSDSAVNRQPPQKRNSVKKACRLLSIIDGLKSAPKENKPSVSPTSFASPTVGDSSQTTHKSRKDTVPKQYNSSSKQYQVKKDAVETCQASKNPCGATSGSADLNSHTSSSSYHQRTNSSSSAMVTSSLHSSLASLTCVPKPINPLDVRQQIPLPLIPPFPIIPFGMSIPPTLYASMTQNGVPLEWQLALMNNQFGPNELALLTSAMAHQSVLLQQTKPTKKEAAPASKSSSTSASSTAKQRSAQHSAASSSKASHRASRHSNSRSEKNKSAASSQPTIHPAFGGVVQPPVHKSYREALSQRAMASVQKSGSDQKSGINLSWADLRGTSELLAPASATVVQPRAVNPLDLTKRYAQTLASEERVAAATPRYKSCQEQTSTPDLSCQPLDLSLRK